MDQQNQNLAPAVPSTPPQPQTNQPAASPNPREIAKNNIASRLSSPTQQVVTEDLGKAMSAILNIIAPSSFAINSNYLQLGSYFIKTLFVFTYPRYLDSNWLSPVIDFDITMDISLYIHPLETKSVMGELKQQVGKLESTMQIEQEKGAPRDPEIETALGDIENLRDVLQRGEMRLFKLGLYFTVYAKSIDELKGVCDQIESTLGGLLIYTKETLFQMEQGFSSTLPLLRDKVNVLRNLDTGSLSTIFPFTSSDLTEDNGILYGINLHNNSLIIFDRFNLENANSIVLAKSGSGKSYFVKLEALRYLMLGTDVIVVDPENEYLNLCNAVGGSYLTISLNSDKRINPFDLPINENEAGEDVLRSTVASLHGLINLMSGGMTPQEDAIVDKALYETYALKDITIDPMSQKNEPPILQDFYNVLANMHGTDTLRAKLSKFVEGSFSNLYNQRTNFELKQGFVVFSVRDLDEELRPIAIYTILEITETVQFVDL